MHISVSFLIVCLASAGFSQEATNVPDLTSTPLSITNASLGPAPETGVIHLDNTQLIMDTNTNSETSTTTSTSTSSTTTTTPSPEKVAEAGNKTAEIIAQTAQNVTIPTQFPEGVCGYTRTPSGSTKHVEETLVSDGVVTQEIVREILNWEKVPQCCPGFKDMNGNCTRSCGGWCQNGGYCDSDTNKCKCPDGMIQGSNGDCVPKCPNGCENGMCIEDLCACNPGYHIDPTGEFCIPQCKAGCGLGGKCVAPGVCDCAEGFMTIAGGSGCRAHCSLECVNGNCVGPDECECRRNDWVKITTNICVSRNSPLLSPAASTSSSVHHYHHQDSSYGSGISSGGSHYGSGVSTLATIGAVGGILGAGLGLYSVLKSRDNKPYYGGYSSLGYGGYTPSPSIPHNYFGGVGQPGYGFQPNQYYYHNGYTPGYHTPQLGQNYWNQPHSYHPNQPYYPPPPGATHQQSGYNPYNPNNQPNHYQNQPSSYNPYNPANTQHGKQPYNPNYPQQSGHNPNYPQQPGHNPNYPQQPGHNPNYPQQPAHNPNYPQQPAHNPNYPTNTANNPHNPSAPPKDHSTHVNSGVPGGFNNSHSSGGGFNSTRNNQASHQTNNHQCTGCFNGRCVGPNNCVCNGGYVKQGGTCRPHCAGGCTNGACSSPGHCICNAGYIKQGGACVSASQRRNQQQNQHNQQQNQHNQHNQPSRNTPRPTYQQTQTHYQQPSHQTNRGGSSSSGGSKRNKNRNRG